MLRVWLLLPLLLLGACSNINALKKNQHISGTATLFNQDVIEKIDLARELDPGSKGLAFKKVNIDDIDLNDSRKNLREAFESFYDNLIGQQQRRNRVQERILIASAQRCGEYKKFLKQLDAGSNFGMGSAATLLAGAGAIFTPVSTVRALSGSASIVSGIKAEMNADYFSNQSIQIITHAFEVKRRLLYKEMLKKRSQSLIDYPVEAAIKDAVIYHASCSLLTGLEEASRAVERIENPGLKGAQQALIAAKNLQRIMQTEPKDIAELEAEMNAPTRSSSSSSFPNDFYKGDGLPIHTLGKMIAAVKNYAVSFEKLKAKLLERHLIDKKDELNEMSLILDRAIAQTVLAIEDYRLSIKSESIQITKLRSDVLAEVDGREKRNKQLLLNIAIVKSEQNRLIITSLYKEFQLRFQAMAHYLEDSRLSGTKSWQKTASDQLREIIYDMAIKLVKHRQDLEGDKKFMVSIKSQLKNIFGSNEKDAENFRSGLLGKSFSEFKGDNKEKLFALEGISKKISDAVKEK